MQRAGQVEAQGLVEGGGEDVRQLSKRVQVIGLDRGGGRTGLDLLGALHVENTGEDERQEW